MIGGFPSFFIPRYPGGVPPSSYGLGSPWLRTRTPFPASLRSRQACRWTELACRRWCATWASPSCPPWLWSKTAAGGKPTDDWNCAPRGCLWGRFLGTNQRRLALQLRQLNARKPKSQGVEKGLDESGSGDWLLSDARRPGSWQIQRERQWRRDLDRGGTWDYLSAITGFPAVTWPRKWGVKLRCWCGGGLRRQPQVPRLAGGAATLLFPHSSREQSQKS